MHACGRFHPCTIVTCCQVTLRASPWQGGGAERGRDRGAPSTSTGKEGCGAEARRGRTRPSHANSRQAHVHAQASRQKHRASTTITAAAAEAARCRRTRRIGRRGGGGGGATAGNGTAPAPTHHVLHTPAARPGACVHAQHSSSKRHQRPHHVHLVADHHLDRVLLGAVQLQLPHPLLLEVAQRLGPGDVIHCRERRAGGWTLQRWAHASG